jgi:cytochrome c5
MNLSFKSVLFTLCLASFGCIVQAAEDTVAERTKPVGETCMAGQPCAAAVVAAVSSGPRTGEAIFNSKCTTCHATGVAGAPKLGDSAAWAPRLAERKAEGLYASAMTGRNAMPPKGLCMDCSEDEIKSTVDYMLSKAK